MFPLQVFEEGETSKTFKAGGAKSFEGGRREGEEGVEGEGGGRRREERWEEEVGCKWSRSSLGQQLPH